MKIQHFLDEMQMLKARKGNVVVKHLHLRRPDQKSSQKLLCLDVPYTIYKGEIALDVYFPKKLSLFLQL